jgi:hypothetical protein
MAVKRGKKEAAAERRVNAFDLRKAGASYRAIGRALGVSEAQAHRDVHLTLDELASRERESALQVREIELERLDEMLRALWPAVRRGDTSSISTALRVAERRARLLGLDAPVKQELTGANGGPVSFVDVARQFADAARKPAGK